MAGMEYMKEKPFSDVYFTGMVRDKQGRKMSKSLGNSPDLLDLIEKYGADAVRFGIMISSPAGNDLLFDEGSLEQGRNFNNKLWNALKLVKMWEAKQAPDVVSQALTMSQFNVGTDIFMPGMMNPIIIEEEDFATQWFQNRLNEVKAEVENLYNQFRLSEALKTIYSLIWDDFCSWYLEWVKPGFEQSIAENIYSRTVYFYEELMQLLHPFMPFITEEIYHTLQDHSHDLTVKQFQEIGEVKKEILLQGNILKEVITSIRDARNKNQIKPKEKIKLHIQTEEKKSFEEIENILSKQINAETISYTKEPVAGSITVVEGKNKFYIEADRQIDTSAQKDQLIKDLKHLKHFLNSVEKKLNNERFVQNASPAIIALERKKKEDAETKIKTIEDSLTLIN
jgi:valyl-tRNA synthetase